MTDIENQKMTDIVRMHVGEDSKAMATVVKKNNMYIVEKYIDGEKLPLYEGPFDTIEEAELVAEDFVDCTY